ncbi:hypothetical protein FMM56_03835 [Campylobacter sp. LR264d]|uniref:hypothetical protein n=1 Tax=Campylobacter sp. LR264d TaxID=2593544 RepID=UPI00123BB040|nr:hypothetical protein [Campylobacter sp. LR264d]KAA6231306.1 hypothetical protein FMM56_03835 [Campylobacter sp. LR264d]
MTIDSSNSSVMMSASTSALKKSIDSSSNLVGQLTGVNQSQAVSSPAPEVVSKPTDSSVSSSSKLDLYA